MLYRLKLDLCNKPHALSHLINLVSLSISFSRFCYNLTVFLSLVFVSRVLLPRSSCIHWMTQISAGLDPVTAIRTLRQGLLHSHESFDTGVFNKILFTNFAPNSEFGGVFIS